MKSTAVLYGCFEKSDFFTKCRKQPYRVKSTAVSYVRLFLKIDFFLSVENSRTFEKKITKYNSQLLEVLAAKIVHRPHHIANLKTCTEIREKT